MHLTPNHAALLRCYAKPRKHQHDQEMFLAILRDQIELDPKTWAALTNDLVIWGMVTITERTVFGGPYANPTLNGRDWAAANPE